MEENNHVVHTTFEREVVSGGIKRLLFIDNNITTKYAETLQGETMSDEGRDRRRGRRDG